MQTKDILVTTYNGSVLLYDFPKSFRRNEVYTIVRDALEILTNRCHVDLMNVEYYTSFGIDDEYIKGENYIQVNNK